MPTITRNIQFFGLLIPATDFEIAKFYSLTFDLVRKPTQPYTNTKYPLARGLFGYLQTLSSGKVTATYALEYERQYVCMQTYTAYFLHQALSCHLESMLDSFINVANYLQPGFVIQRNNPIKAWGLGIADFDEIRVKFLDERTVGSITLDYEIIDRCNIPLSDPPNRRREKPPLNVDVPFPADIPNASIPPISPPYRPNNDDGLTYNPDGLPPENPGEGINCAIYRIEYEYGISVRRIATSAIEITPISQFGVNCYGPIGAIRGYTNLPQPSITLECRGEVTLLGCLPSFGENPIFSTEPSSDFDSFQWIGLRILSVTLLTLP